MDYKNAGVDIEAGYESVELMKKFVKGTMRPEVLGDNHPLEIGILPEQALLLKLSERLRHDGYEQYQRQSISDICSI